MLKINIVAEGYQLFEFKENHEYHLRVIKEPKIGDRQEKMLGAFISFPSGNMDFFQFLISLEKNIQKVRYEVEALLRPENEGGLQIKKELEPYQQRVIDEKEDLDEKINRLDTFFGNPLCAALPIDEQELLRWQSITMKQYSNILGKRIAKF